MNYASSPVQAWLENTYYNLFDAGTKSGIKYVKIPYSYASGSRTGYVTGASGIAVHCFLPSMYEGRNKIDSSEADGYALSYFADLTYAQTKPLRIAYDAGGAARQYITRTVVGGGTSGYQSYKYQENGEISCNNQSCYIRPAMILDPNMLVNNDGSVTVNTAPSAPGSISVPGSIQGGSTITVSWSAASDAQGNLEGYKVERSINSGAWTQIYQGGGTSTTNNVAYGTNTVMYRVKAYDSFGAESGYKTSNNITVINNTAPGTPQGITVPADVKGGKQLKISWGAGRGCRK